MRTLTALIVKFLMTALVAGITLGYIDGNDWSSILSFSVVATALNYIIGDLFVLPRMGNVVASIGDGGLAALTAYLFSVNSIYFNTSFTSLFLLAALVAMGEFFFHQYLLHSRKVAP